MLRMAEYTSLIVQVIAIAFLAGFKVITGNHFSKYSNEINNKKQCSLDNEDGIYDLFFIHMEM